MDELENLAVDFVVIDFRYLSTAPEVGGGYEDV